MLLDSNKLDSLSLINIKTLQDNKMQILGGVMSRKILLENISGGLSGFTVYNSTIELSDTLLAKPFGTSITYGFRKDIHEMNYEDTYYIRYKIKSNDDLVNMFIGHGGTTIESRNVSKDEVIVLSGVTKILSYEMRLRASRTIGTKESSYEILEFQVINLTTTFGAGNEPDKQTMDKIIDTLGYFETQEIYWGELI